MDLWQRLLASRAEIKFSAESVTHGHTFSLGYNPSSRHHLRLSSSAVGDLAQKYTPAYGTRKAHKAQLLRESRSGISDDDTRHTVSPFWFGQWLHQGMMQLCSVTGVRADFPSLTFASSEVAVGQQR